MPQDCTYVVRMSLAENFDCFPQIHQLVVVYNLHVSIFSEVGTDSLDIIQLCHCSNVQSSIFHRSDTGSIPVQVM